VVVQCPTCQSKFRIADDKVTDRGVRVRCTSCKNVFQVRKPGSANSEHTPGPGGTLELSALDAAALSRPAPRNSALAAARAATAAAAKPPPAPAASRTSPAAAPARAGAPARPAAAVRPAPAARGGAIGARQLDADDLFGMAELTGDAPLGEIAPPKTPPPPAPAPARPAARPFPNFDDIEIDVGNERADDPAPKPAASRTKPITKPIPTRPPTRATAPADDMFAEEAAAHVVAPAPAEEAADAAGTAEPSVNLGGFKTKLDPFDDISLAEPGGGAEVERPAAVRQEKPETKPETRPAAPPPMEPAPPPAPGMVSSALTGLVGAGLAIAVVLAAALSDDAAAGWLGLGPSNDVVATRVVSGLYDTVAGKPVFFVRGRIENRGQKPRGPVRVVAELVAEGAPEARAEAIAGAEPSAEDVWSLRTPAEAEKLNRTLESNQAERRVQPGASIPFFAVIAEPPADLGRHKLHLRVEPIDAWVPAPAKVGKGR
jgi:predicted Zn finger-like uncharacterized protein